MWSSASLFHTLVSKESFRTAPLREEKATPDSPGIHHRL
jgi:hypothetical protein